MTHVPLDTVRHRALLYQAERNREGLRDLQYVPLIAAELGQAGAYYPVLFIKDKDTGRFVSVALMGLEKGQNVYFATPAYRDAYLPAHIRRGPFALAINEQRARILIDEDHPALNDTEGEPLFAAEDNEDDPPARIRTEMQRLYQEEQISMAFNAALAEAGLLRPARLQLFYDDGRNQQIDGLYVINEPALGELDDPTALEFHRRRYWGPIYASLYSLEHLYDLPRLAVTEGVSPVKDLRLALKDN